MIKGSKHLKLGIIGWCQEQFEQDVLRMKKFTEELRNKKFFEDFKNNNC